MSFLNAEWKKLAIANFGIEPEILSEFVPAGTEPDLWQNKCYVSLVGFMFLNTRLLGLKIPFHINFEEVNLRFYVKRIEDGKIKRGVVFIKEIVPKPALTLVANGVYKENYETMPMNHRWEETAESLWVEYQWKKAGQMNSFLIEADLIPSEIEPNSKTEFITEHYWGYAKVNEQKSIEYQVTHPRWKAYQVRNFKLDVDFGEVYGQKFDFLNELQPDSVMLAEGSEITVEHKRTILVNPSMVQNP